MTKKKGTGPDDAGATLDDLLDTGEPPPPEDGDPGRGTDEPAGEPRPPRVGPNPLTRSLADALPGAMQILRERATGDRRPVPLELVIDGEPRPWQQAKAALGGGLWPGLWILVGATGTGKTQLALSLALGAALRGCPVAYVGLELDDPGIVARLLGLLGRRPWSSLYLGVQANREGRPMLDDVEAAAERLASLPFRLVEGDPMGWAPDRLADVARELDDDAKQRGIDTKKNPPLIVLDFLQIVGDTDAALQDRRSLPVRERIQAAAYRARAAAREQGIAVLAVSSTSRENVKLLDEAGADGLPWPGSLVGTGKESGEIEYSADGVLVLVPHPKPPDPPPGSNERRPVPLVSLAVAKVRAGDLKKTGSKPAGWLHLAFDGHSHRPATEHEAEQIEQAAVSAATTPGALLVAGKAEQAKVKIADCGNVAALREALGVEQKGAKRTTVITAIQARIADLGDATSKARERAEC